MSIEQDLKKKGVSQKNIDKLNKKVKDYIEIEKENAFNSIRDYEKEQKNFIKENHYLPDYVKGEFTEDYKKFHIIKKHSKLSYKYWIKAFKESKTPHKNIIANIELNNGFRMSFIVSEDNDGFIWDNKKFIFDNVSKNYNISHQLFEYDYHESFSLPIKRVINKTDVKTEEIVLPIKKGIPVEDIRFALENSGISQVEYASNPSALHKFVNSNVIKMILAGVELDAVFKFLKLITILIFIVCVIILFVVLKFSGLLKFGG